MTDQSPLEKAIESPGKGNKDEDEDEDEDEKLKNKARIKVKRKGRSAMLSSDVSEKSTMTASKDERGWFQLRAPLSGPIVPLELVPDPVFSQRLVGDGIAIDPTTSTLVAPCSGRVTHLHPSFHAVTLTAENGVQVLLHIGLETVTLKGKGFNAKIKVGDRVDAGQELIEFDADSLAREAKSLISLMIVTDAPEHRLTPRVLENAVSGRDTILELNFTGGTSSKLAVARTPDAPTSRADLNSPSSSEDAFSQPIQVILHNGLHARPAATLVSIAKKYKSKIALHKGAHTANAKSLVGLLSLEIDHGDTVHFTAQGPDASFAVAELAELLKSLEDPPERPASTLQNRKTSPMAAVQRTASATTIVGVAASPGVAIGRVHRLQAETFDIPEKGRTPAIERSALSQALKRATDDLATLQARVKNQTDSAQAAIFAAHQELLEDPDLIDQASALIYQGHSAAFAWNQAINQHADRLAHLNNELMANRANDLRDVGRRVLRILVGSSSGAAPRTLSADSILIAENLTPSDTVQLDREKVLGFCTTTGGATSHVAILARSLGLPAIAGIEPRALEIADGTEVVLDGDNGELRLNPSETEKAGILKRQRDDAEKRKIALSQAAQPATTRDGKTIEVAANIGGVADARQAVAMGCDGVGLLRSEFLFLERSVAPSEEEQYQVYQDIADILGERPLVIRTLDVGGDKPLQYLPIPEEENPFLGIRGVRVGLRHPDILREQLRAILRVKSRAKLHIMFPMIATLDEFRQAKALLEEERARLGAAPVAVGIMIEVPSAALIADAFAPEVDFFSIGTNDLTQYTLAMDRGHKDLAKQVDALHPSVLRLMEMTVQAAHRHGKWVGVCGGLAGDTLAVPILLGLGIDELSVSLPSIPLIKAQVRETSVLESQTLARKATRAQDAKEIRSWAVVYRNLPGGLALT